MWTLIRSLLLSVVLSTQLSPGAALAGDVCNTTRGPTTVEIETNLGVIPVELWPDVAPCTVDNFLKYLESGAYDGTFIHRLAKNFVFQGGGYVFREGSYVAIDRPWTVDDEPDLSLDRWTISLARTGAPNSATSEWFINLRNNPGLTDFTAFGIVPEGPGRDVVSAIAALEIMKDPLINSELSGSLYAELPLVAQYEEAPEGYGCHSSWETQFLAEGWLRAIVDVDVQFVEPDPLKDGALFFTDFCDGSGATGPPSVECPAPGLTGRELIYYDPAGLAQGAAWFRFDPIKVVSCDVIAESEAAMTARTADLHNKVSELLVTVIEARVVPEPSAGLLQLAALATLLSSVRRRARQR